MRDRIPTAEDIVNWNPYAGNSERDILLPECRTELCNATRLLDRYAGEFRWVVEWQKPLTWDGKRWALDHGERVESFAKEIALQLWMDVADEVRRGESASMVQTLVKFARDSSTARGIQAMIRLARSDERVVVHHHQLDTNPWLLNVANGTLDLQTGELLPHDRKHLITKLCPVNYVERITANGRNPCPTWQRVIEEITAGAGELASFLQRLAGLWLTGSVREHILPILYGIGANGKSLYLNTLCEVMGTDYAMKAPPDLLMVKRGDAHPTERADLFGKRLVVAIETESGRRLAESLVKELTGGDKIRARRMREDHWEFTPTHKLVVACNHKPVVQGTDNGIWRRLRLVPFTVTIPPEKQDKALPEKLLKEREGILAWMVQGCREWQANGLAEPQSVLVATDDYRGDMDIVSQFIAECCYVAPGAVVGATAIYRAFCEWCERNSETPTKRREFVKEMDDRDFAKERLTSGAHKGREIRIGIGLSSDGEGAE